MFSQSVQQPPPGGRCARHVAEPAQAVCKRCGDFVCRQCVDYRPEGAFCGSCAPEQLIRSTPGTRVLAHLIDGGLFVAAFMLAALPTAWTDTHAGEEVPGFELFAVLTLLLIVGLTVAQCVLIHRRAQSIGKIVMGIRLATLDGGRPSVVGVLFMRNLLPIIIGQIPLVGMLFSVANLVMLFGDERRCLHDQMAGTIVVDTPERQAKR